MPELEFEETAHAYMMGGRRVPSVTQIMEPLSRHEYGTVNPAVLEKAATRGTMVHKSIENFIRYGLDISEPEYGGYMQGFTEWWEKNSPSEPFPEVKIYHKTLMYAGTADLVSVIGGMVILTDFKTTSKVIEKSVRVQLEAYAQALASHGVQVDGKRILHLSKDGHWKEYFYPAKDTEAWSVFGSLKSIHDYINS